MTFSTKRVSAGVAALLVVSFASVAVPTVSHAKPIDDLGEYDATSSTPEAKAKKRANKAKEKEVRKRREKAIAIINGSVKVAIILLKLIPEAWRSPAGVKAEQATKALDKAADQDIKSLRSADSLDEIAKIETNAKTSIANTLKKDAASISSLGGASKPSAIGAKWSKVWKDKDPSDGARELLGQLDKDTDGPIKNLKDGKPADVASQAEKTADASKKADADAKAAEEAAATEMEAVSKCGDAIDAVVKGATCTLTGLRTKDKGQRQEILKSCLIEQAAELGKSEKDTWLQQNASPLLAEVLNDTIDTTVDTIVNDVKEKAANKEYAANRDPLKKQIKDELKKTLATKYLQKLGEKLYERVGFPLSQKLCKQITAQTAPVCGSYSVVCESVAKLFWDKLQQSAIDWIYEKGLASFTDNLEAKMKAKWEAGQVACGPQARSALSVATNCTTTLKALEFTVKRACTSSEAVALVPATANRASGKLNIAGCPAPGKVSKLSVSSGAKAWQLRLVKINPSSFSREALDVIESIDIKVE